MKMKFIKNEESLAWLQERLEQYQHIFEASAITCAVTLGLLEKITGVRSLIKAESLKAELAKHIKSLEWDYDGYFLDSHENELKETVRLMKEAFGDQEEGEIEIPDFAPPVV